MHHRQGPMRTSTPVQGDQKVSHSNNPDLWLLASCTPYINKYLFSKIRGVKIFSVVYCLSNKKKGHGKHTVLSAHERRSDLIGQYFKNNSHCHRHLFFRSSITLWFRWRDKLKRGLLKRLQPNLVLLFYLEIYISCKEHFHDNARRITLSQSSKTVQWAEKDEIYICYHCKVWFSFM